MRPVTFSEDVGLCAGLISKNCLRDHCGRCMNVCPMMSRFGENPGALMEKYFAEPDPALAYSCLTCGLCETVCPKQFPLPWLFTEARKDFVKANGGKSPMPGHRSTRFHQTFGFSAPFTVKAEGSKDGKTRTFLAGCSLSSSAPEEVGKTLSWLNEQLPGMSAVQKCCGLPTKNMGQEDLFQKRITSLEDDFRALGTEEIITACQNCKKVLSENLMIPVRSLWEVLPEVGIPEELRGKAKDSDVVFTIHDSCSARYDTAIHDGIRWLMEELGYKVREAEASREKTLCCGAGGMVNDANPEVAKAAVKRRLETLPSDYIVVYCGTCRSMLATGGGKAWHILDLLYGPVVTSASRPPENVLASTSKAWKNRYDCTHAVETALSKDPK